MMKIFKKLSYPNLLLHFRISFSRAKIGNILLPQNPNKVLIFGQGRSGSTLLESLLTSTGYFNSFGEILLKRSLILRNEVGDPSGYLEGLSRWEKEKWFIAHVKIYQLTRDRSIPKNPKQFLAELVQAGWTIIYIYRNNIIKQSLSNIIADKIGIYNSESIQANFKFTVDLNRFTEIMNARIKYKQQEEMALVEVPHLKINYENDLYDSNFHMKTVRNVLNHLGLVEKNSRTKLKKISIVDMKRDIYNYKEFINIIYDNGWEKYLEY